MGWLADVIVGKIAKNPIYDGMPERDRRKTAHRWSYKTAQTSHFRDETAVFASKLMVAAPSEKQNLEAQFYANHLLWLLYSADHKDDGGHDQYLENTILDKFFDFLPRDIDFESETWASAAEKLGANGAVVMFLPGILGEQRSALWGEYHAKLAKLKAEEEQRLKEQAERIRLQNIQNQERARQKAEKDRAKQQRNTEIRQLITQYEGELRQLRQLLGNSSDSMTRMQITVAHEARERAISQLKSELNG